MRHLLLVALLLTSCGENPTSPPQPYSLNGKVLHSTEQAGIKSRIIDTEGERVEVIHFHQRWRFLDGNYSLVWVRDGDTLYSTRGRYGEESLDWPQTTVWTQRDTGWIVQPHRNWLPEPVKSQEVANFHTLKWSEDGWVVDWAGEAKFNVFWISGARP